MKKSILCSFILFLFGMLLTCTFGQDDIKNDSLLNYDLPALLVSNDGLNIKSVDDWEKIRRSEILEMFETYVYGKIPADKAEVKFKVVKIDNNALSGKATQKEVIVTLLKGEDSLKINVLIFLPNNIQKPVPLFLGMNFYGNQTIHADTNITITPNYVNNNEEFGITNNRASHLSRGVRANRWPIERILERGYGIASVYYGDLDPDFDDGFQNGVHRLFNNPDKLNRASNEWGAISAWAYGLSRAMDFFETDKSIDSKKVIVIGHSRLGKTALWAGAMDQRFAITISNNSGCGGAALSRRKSGETLKDINSRFPHWFCSNFSNYNGREEELPVDQHMLIALLAPRPVYVGSAVEDKWADPPGEYLSLYYAGPAYNLYGEVIFDSKQSPELNQSVIRGKMGYHIRSGGHNLTNFDWEKYMDFADMHFVINKTD